MARLRRISGDESGSITVMMLGCLALVIALCAFSADLGMYLVARDRAQDAADSAALAAVQESFALFSTGQDPRAAAESFASANGVSLSNIDISSGGEKVEVEVSEKCPSLFLGRLGVTPEKISARAAAEVDMEALLASEQIWFTGDPRTLNALRNALANLSSRDRVSAATMVVLLALEHLGQPYVHGATGPDSFDCSGLVCYVYAQIGMRLPRVTFDQVQTGRAVSPTELTPGDLVFFRSNGHVGIYIGGGWFVHAPHTGDVVKISALGERSDVCACRRIL